MANLDSGVGLLFSIKADGSNADEIFAKLEAKSGKSADKISQNFSLAGGKISAVFSSLASKLRATMQRIGTSLTVGLTAPIIAGTYALGNYGLNINELKNQLVAFEGSSEGAEKRLKSLRTLVDGAKGATRGMAYDVYGLLKPLKASDEAIDRTVKALGTLKLGFKNLEPGNFAYNLTQIFGQNFEEQDIKQAIGQVPKFREYLQKAFGTSDNETLRQMKADGKITMESFFTGFAEAVENDDVLKGLEEPTRLRMQKFIERAFESVEPVANRLLDILTNIIETLTPYLEKFAQYFATISPFAQNLLIIIAGIAAALGPALIALAGIISAISSIIGAGTAISAVVAAVGGLLPALGIVAAAIVGLAINFAPLIAAVTALYFSWQTNFGGIRDFSLAAFEKIKEIFNSGLNFIYNLTETIISRITAFWLENYDTIQSIVEKASAVIKNTIGAFLDTVQKFWETHGGRISNYIETAYNNFSSIISTAFDQIQNIIKFALQIIDGDFSGAWETFVEYVRTAAQIITQILSGLLVNIKNLLFAIIPIALEYGIKFQTTLVEWMTKAVVGAIVVLNTLPVRIIKLVPKFLAAGRQIAGAIIQGIKDAFAENPIPVPGGGEIGEQKSIADVRRDDDSDNLPNTSNAQTFTREVDTKALEKQRKDREDALKKQLQDLSRYNQLQIEEERQKFEIVNKETADALEQGAITYQIYQENSLKNLEIFNQNIANLLKKGFDLAIKGKKGQELENEKQAYQNALRDLGAEIQRQRESITKRVTEIEKKESDERVKNTREEIQAKTRLQEAAGRVVAARLEANLAEGLITEEQYNRARQLLRENQLQFQLQQLKAEAAAVADNAEILQQIKLKEIEIEENAEITRKENADQRKRSLEEQKQLQKELLDIQKQIADEERKILDFRADQERKILQNTVESSAGKAKIAALRQLREFEIGEANRRQDQIEADLQSQQDAALKSIEGKENEEEQKFQIEELYKEKRLLSEEEFQAKLKEIRDNINSQIAGEEGKGGFLGGFFSGEQLKAFDENLPFMENALASFGNVAGQVFAGVANGIGSMVQSFVLLGNAGGQSLRKFTAQVLASVASQAAVLAVFELAKGFAALFFNPAEAAAHFTAAALFGSIAGVSAIAGRAIAGDSFKQETAGGYGSAGSSASSGSSANRGGAYSGQEDQVIEGSRNAPARLLRSEITLKIQSNDSHIVETLTKDIRNYGRGRAAIVEVITET